MDVLSGGVLVSEHGLYVIVLVELVNSLLEVSCRLWLEDAEFRIYPKEA